MINYSNDKLRDSKTHTKSNSLELPKSQKKNAELPAQLDFVLSIPFVHANRRRAADDGADLRGHRSMPFFFDVFCVDVSKEVGKSENKKHEKSSSARTCRNFEPMRIEVLTF